MRSSRKTLRSAKFGRDTSIHFGEDPRRIWHEVAVQCLNLKICPCYELVNRSIDIATTGYPLLDWVEEILSLCNTHVVASSMLQENVFTIRTEDSMYLSQRRSDVAN